MRSYILLTANFLLNVSSCKRLGHEKSLKIIVFKCEIETRRMDILCIFLSAEKLNFILNPFTASLF